MKKQNISNIIEKSMARTAVARLTVLEITAKVNPIGKTDL